MKDYASRRRAAGRLSKAFVLGFLIALTAFPEAAGAAPGSIAGPSAAAGQAEDLPPVPKEAEDAYFRAFDIIQMLTRQSDKAVGSPQWDVAIKRLMEAHDQAPAAPRILRDLGLAHQYRGRASAAVAWFKAAFHAINRFDADSPELRELAKRIDTLSEVPRNQMELALTFALEEIPYMHAKRLPDLGPSGELFPPTADPPAGPVMVDLGNGQWVRNPELYNKDGSPKVRDIPRQRLEEALIRFRLGIGDASAIKEAETFYRAQSGSDPLSWSYVRLNAYNMCLRALTEAESWSEVARVAEEAADWCDRFPNAWNAGQAPQFRELSRQMNEALENAAADKVTQWTDLARELARSDDEVYFQVKIDDLHKMTEKSERLLEGIVGAVEPIGRNLMRLRSIAD
jgi:hypothetical protein